MRVQRKTDRSIAAHDALAHQVETMQVETMMEGAVGRFADQITRVEVHLSDENRHQGGGDDTRCMLEARLSRQAPPWPHRGSPGGRA
jgi:hypothetical protein